MNSQKSFFSFFILIGVMVFFSSCTTSKTNPVYLALGDSYTIGTAIGEEKSYANLLTKALNDSLKTKKYTLQIIAQNGWTTADLLRGITATAAIPKAELVTLLIGVNNQYQHLPKLNYRTEFTELVVKSISAAGGKKENVWVLSIPDYGVCPAGLEQKNSIENDIDAYNKINKSVSDSLGVNYINITEISRTALQNPDLVAQDGLHFSAEMHELWLEKLLPDIYRKVKQLPCIATSEN